MTSPFDRGRMVPQRRPGPNPRKLCIVTLHDKRDCADLIKVLYI